MVFFHPNAFTAALFSSLVLMRNTKDAHGKENSFYVHSQEIKEESEGYYYDACHSCLPIRSFGDFDRLIIDDQVEHVLNLCGWKGSLSWPSEAAYTFSNNGTVFIMNCCGQSCEFDGREERRDKPILDFDGGTIEHVEMNGFTFVDFLSDNTFIRFDQSVGYFDFQNNVLHNVDANTVILFTSDAFGAVIRMNNNVFMGNDSGVTGFASVLSILGGGADVTMKSNKFMDNSAKQDGGVMRIIDSTLHMKYNLFEGNKADSTFGCGPPSLDDGNDDDNNKKGGRKNGNGRDLQVNGEGVTGGVLQATNVVIYSEGNKFINNFSEGNGGAIFAIGICLYSRNDVFVNNSVKCFNGGALRLTSGVIEITHALFKNNTAGEFRLGGAVYTASICAEVTYSTFEDNISQNLGGGWALERGGSFVSKRNIFKNNKAAFFGGAVYVEDGRLESTEDLFEENMEIFGSGGAVYVRKNGHLIKGAKFVRNTAQRGGGVGCREAVCTVKDSIFEDNNATVEDGGNDINIEDSLLETCDNSFFPEMSIDNQEDSSVVEFLCEDDELVYEL